jgi:hypothetical protein
MNVMVMIRGRGEEALARAAPVVEFGVGNSTLVMAEALARNGSGKLWTTDVSARWLGDTHRCIPDRLRHGVELRQSALETMQIDGDPCHRFVSHPPADRIDLLFLDGPSPKDVPGWVHGGKRPVAADPVLLEDRFAEGFRMIVDARAHNVAFLKRHLKRRYRVRTDPVFKITTFDLL